MYIEGRLRVEEWTDRDGKQRHTLEVHATDMQFIGGGRGEEAVAAAAAAPARGQSPGEPATSDVEITDDDIPF